MYSIKTVNGYISINYPHNKTPDYMFTDDPTFIKQYRTKAAARMVLTRLGVEGEVLPYEFQYTMTDEEINEIIDN